MAAIETRAVTDLLDLSGETILVTGASGNIGAAIARRLAEAGGRIVAHYHRNAASLEALRKDIDCESVCADLADTDAVEDMLSKCRPTMVVNNAASQTVTPLANMTLDEWRSMLAANLDSAYLITQQLAKRWSSNREAGAIVNIASIEGIDPAQGHAHYATSKAALLMLTKAIALEFGGAGIRANAVSPGLIYRDALAAEWPEGVARWQERAPLRRIGVPNDVADAVLFLLSDAARWISGANLIVDGGMSAQGKW